MTRTRAEDKDIFLSVEIDKDTPEYLNGDELRIKQILTNLLTNAVKYTEMGKITFGINYEKESEDPDSVILNVWVADTGIGIKEEDLGKLFDEFERVDIKKNKNIEGTGLGLSITKRLLEMMGSELKVESKYGSGSKFYFSLKQKVVDWKPIGNYEETYKSLIEERHEYKEKFTAPLANILVVDDNPMNLKVFTGFIKRTKIKIDTAKDGFEGINLSKERKYDIIYMDHMMPGKDGIEALHDIRQDGQNRNADTPIICLTANAISGARDAYIKEGFNDYITKPIDPEKLEHTLLQYLPDNKIIVGAWSDEDSETEKDSEADLAIIEKLKGSELIDSKIGLENSGSAKSYIELMKIFRDAIDKNSEDIEACYLREDYKEYTIKVHALKSSAKLIGAMELAEKAQKLENAGKSNDHIYILSHENEFIEYYMRFSALLKEVLKQEEKNDKPLADADLMNEAYAEIKEAAEAMDLSRLESAFEEMKDYRVPDDQTEFFEKLKDAADRLDYEEIVKLFN